MFTSFDIVHITKMINKYYIIEHYANLHLKKYKT